MGGGLYGRWTLPLLMRLLAALLARVEGYPPSLRPAGTTPGWTALAAGALFGALSHVALDGIIHADVRPFGAGNPLYVPGGFVLVHVLCLVTGVVGAAAWGAQIWRAGRQLAAGADRAAGCARGTVRRARRRNRARRRDDH